MTKKLREDIEPTEVETEMPEELLDCMSQAWIPDDAGNHVPFYVIWDMSRIEKYLGVEGDSRARDELLDEFLGQDCWGWDDEYIICDNCGKAVYTQGYYKEYEYLETAGYMCCNDCIEHDRNCRQDYIDLIKNDPDYTNYILTDAELEEEGWVRVEVYEGYWRQRNPKSILTDFQERYPGIDFLFNNEVYDAFSIWASQELPEEEEEPEEEKSDEQE